MKIKVSLDPYVECPLDKDDIYKIAYLGRSRYVLGTYPVDTDTDIYAILDDPRYIALPVYAYIHGGVSMNTFGYSDPWDSGMSGVAFIAKEDIYREWGVKRISAKFRARIEGVLRDIVKEFGHWASGDNYYIAVEDDDGELIDCTTMTGDQWGIEREIAGQWPDADIEWD